MHDRNRSRYHASQNSNVTVFHRWVRRQCGQTASQSLHLRGFPPVYCKTIPPGNNRRGMPKGLPCFSRSANHHPSMKLCIGNPWWISNRLIVRRTAPTPDSTAQIVSHYTAFQMRIPVSPPASQWYRPLNSLLYWIIPYSHVPLTATVCFKSISSYIALPALGSWLITCSLGS